VHRIIPNPFLTAFGLAKPVTSGAEHPGIPPCFIDKLHLTQSLISLCLADFAIGAASFHGLNFVLKFDKLGHDNFS
jgi:hypothetical protein